MRYIIILLTIFQVLSCSDEFLEKDPQAVVFDDNLADREGLEGLLIGAYSVLDGVIQISSWETSGSNWIYGDIYADEAYKGSDENDQRPITAIEVYEHKADNDYFLVRWRVIYDGVARSNLVIRMTELALSKNTITDEEAIQFYAEARFLRGFYHLEAIKMWDFIPYIHEYAEDGLVENKPASTTTGDLPWGNVDGDGYIPWNEVEADFLYAIEHLPEDPRNGHKGRAHKYAAMSLIAKTKLFQGKYGEALSLLNTVITSNKFQLAINYHDNFSVEGDNNIESIFQIQASVNDGADGGFWYSSMNGNFGDILNSPYGGGPGKCCGFYAPSQNLVNCFKTTDGLVGGGIPEGLPYIEFYELDFNAETDDVKNDEEIESNEPFTVDTRPLDPRLDWTVGRRGIPYLDWGDHPGKDWIRDQNFAGPYSPKKNAYYFKDEGIYSAATGWAAGQNAINYSIIRYADVLLMAAECEVENSGDLARARDFVNQMRERAGKGGWVLENGAEDDGSHVGPNDEPPAANYTIELYPDSGPYNPFQTQDGARQAVRFERRLEFGMEGHRFWDLKRWGIAQSTLKAYLEKESKLRSYLVGKSFKDRNIRHPIPQEEIDLMQGLLNQNPGY